MFFGQCLAFPFDKHFQFVAALIEFVDQRQIFVQRIVHGFSGGESLITVLNLGPFREHRFMFRKSGAELPDLLLPLGQRPGAFRDVFLQLKQMRPFGLQ